jgi:curved DNA-binding protein CbpA
MSSSKGRSTLYDLLGTPQGASTAQLQAAYREQVNALEAQRASLSADDFNERRQLLRLAYDTLADPVSRAQYDATQEAAARSARAAVATGTALASTPALAGSASIQARADALSMRADALSIRADALLMRAGVGAPTERSPGLAAAADLYGALKRMVRALGLLVVLGVCAFGVSRCAMSGAAEKRTALEQRASEQAALQDYYQTHGVRPANLADMELMEASRRLQENERRQAEQARRQREDQERRFEAESRRIGREVSERLQRSEEVARQRADRKQQLKFEADQLLLESKLAQSEADRRRILLRREQILQQSDQL